MNIQNSKFKIQKLRYLYCIKNSHRGNALVSVLFIAMISITISTAAIFMLSNSMLAASKSQLGEEAYTIAESGAENAILRLLRDPSYTGEVLPIGDGEATTIISGSSPYTIQSVGKIGDFTRTIQVQVGYNADQVLSVISWQEIEP